MEYWLHILIMVAIYSIAALALNLVAGYTGLLSIAHAAFYGIGAYVVALMALRLGCPFWASILCAAAMAGLLGLIVSIPSIRVHDDYFVLVTFGMQVIATGIMTNWIAATNGQMGLPGIPQPALFGFVFDTHWRFLALSWTVAIATFVFCFVLVRAPFGRVLRAIREDELFAQAMGKNVTYHKVAVFVVSAALAGIAGGLYASYITFIDPMSFTIQESIFMLAIVIVGGAGNLWGSLLGAVILVAIPEFLRFLGLPSFLAANIRQMLYGALLVILMLFRPRGMLGEFSFRKN